MLFRKLWLSLCAGALLAAHPLQAEEPTQLREVRVAYIGILPSETTEHADFRFSKVTARAQIPIQAF